MIAIISDVHGNYISLQEVLKTIDHIGSTEIFLRLMSVVMSYGKEKFLA